MVRLLQDHLRVHRPVADCGIAAELQNPIYEKDRQRHQGSHITGQEDFAESANAVFCAVHLWL